MYLLLLVSSLALAIPTFGFSVIAFLFYHSYDARKNAKTVIQAIGLSAENNETLELPYIGRSAIKKAFEALHSDDYEVEVYPTSKLTTFCGTVHHPKFATKILVQIHVQSGTGGPRVMTISADKVETNWVDDIAQKILTDMAEARQKNNA